MEIIKYQAIQFVIMFLFGFFLNPMNMLAYSINDFYTSITLFYSGLFMASNMIWAHEIVHYFSMNHLNMYVFAIGILLSGICLLLLRTQVLVTDEQWLRRMIPHHSTALTTSKNILNKSQDENIKRLAKSIIETQEKEIQYMRSLLQNY